MINPFAWFRNRQLRRQRWEASERFEIKFLPNLSASSGDIKIPDRDDQYPAYVPVSSYPHPRMEVRGDQLSDVLVADLGMATRLECIAGWGVIYVMPHRARAAVAEHGGDFSPGWRSPSDGEPLVLTELCLTATDAYHRAGRRPAA